MGAGQTAVLRDFQAARDFKIEIETIEAWYGPNAYTTYLRKYGKRPNQEEAAIMGRLMGGRVKADDGSMQPPLNDADRAVRRGIKLRRKAFARRYEQITRLKAAIVALSENQDDPAEIIGDGTLLLDSPEVVAQLGNAVFWLNRFAECWYDRTQKASAQNSKLSGGNQKQGRT